MTSAERINMENNKNLTQRQCNNCKRFMSSDIVCRYQKYNRIRSVGDIMYLCEVCLELIKDPKFRYIKMSEYPRT
jgi:hypothetical protein